MRRRQTRFVCFRNLLVDHLRSSEQPGTQCNRGRKPGAGGRGGGQTGALNPACHQEEPVSPHKVRLQWKCVTLGSADTACLRISSNRVCVHRAAFVFVVSCMTGQTGMRNGHRLKYVILSGGRMREWISQTKRAEELWRPATAWGDYKERGSEKTKRREFVIIRKGPESSGSRKQLLWLTGV